LAQLEVDLSKLDSAACFAILAEPFSKGPPSEVGSAAQEYAGRLLLRLKPPPPLEPQQTMRLLLSNWDVSVEQLPWYLEAVFGTGVPIAALVQLERDPNVEVGRRIDTVRFWLRVPLEPRS
jgi:hypothetical protein